MGVVVQFDYAAWIARYPEFAYIGAPQASAYFAEAGAFHANDGSGPVKTAALQSVYMNMMTAHIAQRYAASATGVAASPIVGRIGSASEGSVSVQTDNAYPPGTVQWYQQTKYGSDYWAATAGYRTMRYAAKPTIVANGLYPLRQPL